MKILQIVPGTANFYCGSCIRDTALCKAIKQRGHDVILQPLYLPLLSEEENLHENSTVFFGGINMYLQQKTDFFRKTPRWVDRLLDSKSLLKLSATQVGMTKPEELGEMMVSMLLGKEGRQAKEFERFISWLKEQEAPDVIILPNGMLVSLAMAIQSEFSIPVVCTLQGEDSFINSLPEPYRSDAWRQMKEHTGYVDAFIPVSHYYAGVMAEHLDLPEDKCFVIQNGIPLQDYHETSERECQLSLGFLAHLRKEKGLHLLVEAFIRLKKDPKFAALKLKIAGTTTNADKPYIEDLQSKLRAVHLSGDVEFYTNIPRDEKIRFLESLTVLSVPATYGESFGLYVIEAMAAGTPVVQPRTAGFTEIIEQTQGGILYPEGDMDAYVSALEEMLTNPEKARTIGEQGRKAVHEQFSIEQMAEKVIRVLEHSVLSKRQIVE
jgi:glycosyltransferase involved in cell wall biosynthesis